MIRVVLRDRFYVSLEAIDRAALKSCAEVDLQTKSLCRTNCPLANKQGRYCSTCPSQEAKVKMWQLLRLKSGRKVIALPAGDDSILKEVVRGKFHIIDQRLDRPMNSQLRWTGKLRSGGTNDKGERESDQKGMLKSWVQHIGAGNTGGIIISPPRSGKCVVAGTLIKTDQGYEAIENLFEGVAIEDTIGMLGDISVYNSTAKIQGLHKRSTESTVTIELENGVELGGTPEHPVAVCSKNSRLRDGPKVEGVAWVHLAKVEVGNNLFFPPIARNDRQSAIIETALIGHCVAATDLTDLDDGRVIIDGISDYGESEEFAKMLSAITTLELADGLEFNLNMYCRDRDWKKRILSATDAEWRSFIEAMFSTNFSPTPSVMLPDLLARATTYQLLGNGVECSLRKEPFGLVVVVHDVEGLSRYTKYGERPIGTESGLMSRVVRIVVEDKPQTVYDLMTSERAFNTNGLLSHNTVIGTAAAMAAKSRTFITGSQSRFIKQFGRTFGNNTNLKKIAGPRNYPVVMIDPKGWIDAKKYGVRVLKTWGPEVDKADVIMCAYQQLIGKNGPSRVRRYLQGKIGNAIVDEAHQSAAPCLSRLINRLNVRRRLGLTATSKRKDGLSPVMTAVLGRTVAVGRVTSTLPSLRIFETGIQPKREYKQWSAMETFLAKNEQRNRLIVRQVFKDLREDKKHFLLLPVTRIQHNIDLVRMINTQADYCRKHKGEDWPTPLAVSYKGGGDLDRILNGVDSGKIRVVVATNSMVKFGIDVPRWTHVYIGLIPTSNAANVYQAMNRCCTPYTSDLENKIGPKPTPIVRIVVDDMPASVFCFKKVWENTDYGLRGALSGQNYYGVKLARIGPQTLQRMEEICRYPKSYSFSDSVKQGRAPANVRRGSIWRR
jgi:hypothetical protein